VLIKQLLAVAEVGATLVLYLLIALSVVSIAIIIDRFVWFRRRRIDVRRVGDTLVQRLFHGEVEQARAELAASPSIEGEVISRALAWYHRGPAATAEIIGSELRERKLRIEGGLLFLGTLGNNAPFVGLFGTVLGIVTAFRELGNAGQSGAMNNVMGGISEALVSTAVGILVALPAVVAYNVFQRRAQQIEENVEALGNKLMAQMKSEPDATASERVAGNQVHVIGARA
jgi:biopolymer transport protein ExbB/biopolymer transport protein TolQ